MYSKIMVAVDLSDSSQQVLSKMASLLAEQEADYQVVCCYEPMLGLMADMALPVTGFDDTEVVQAMSQRLAELVDSAGLDASKIRVIENIVGPGLCQHAELLNADLLLIGSHGRSGLRFLLGSTTNYVLHHASCDVLAVKIQSE